MTKSSYTNLRLGDFVDLPNIVTTAICVQNSTVIRADIGFVIKLPDGSIISTMNTMDNRLFGDDGEYYGMNPTIKCIAYDACLEETVEIPVGVKFRLYVGIVGITEISLGIVVFNGVHYSYEDGYISGELKSTEVVKISNITIVPKSNVSSLIVQKIEQDSLSIMFDANVLHRLKECSLGDTGIVGYHVDPSMRYTRCQIVPILPASHNESEISPPLTAAKPSGCIPDEPVLSTRSLGCIGMKVVEPMNTIYLATANVYFVTYPIKTKLLEAGTMVNGIPVTIDPLYNLENGYFVRYIAAMSESVPRLRLSDQLVIRVTIPDRSSIKLETGSIIVGIITNNKERFGASNCRDVVGTECGLLGWTFNQLSFQSRRSASANASANVVDSDAVSGEADAVTFKFIVVLKGEKHFPMYVTVSDVSVPNSRISIGDSIFVVDSKLRNELDTKLTKLIPNTNYYFGPHSYEHYLIISTPTGELIEIHGSRLAVPPMEKSCVMFKSDFVAASKHFEYLKEERFELCKSAELPAIEFEQTHGNLLTLYDSVASAKQFRPKPVTGQLLDKYRNRTIRVKILGINSYSLEKIFGNDVHIVHGENNTWKLYTLTSVTTCIVTFVPMQLFTFLQSNTTVYDVIDADTNLLTVTYRIATAYRPAFTGTLIVRYKVPSDVGCIKRVLSQIRMLDIKPNFYNRVYDKFVFPTGRQNGAAVSDDRSAAAAAAFQLVRDRNATEFTKSCHYSWECPAHTDLNGMYSIVPSSSSYTALLINFETQDDGNTIMEGRFVTIPETKLSEMSKHEYFAVKTHESTAIEIPGCVHINVISGNVKFAKDHAKVYVEAQKYSVFIAIFSDGIETKVATF